MENFSSLAQLKNKSLQFDEGEYRSVKCDGKLEKDYRAIYNKTQNELVTIKKVSKNILIQHKEAVETFIDTAVTMGLSFKGNVIDSGSKLAIKFFTNNNIEASTKEKINEGIVLFNDYAKGLYLGWQGINLSCMNQMNANFTSKAVRITNVDMLPSKIKTAITDIMKRNIDVKNYVENAIKDSLEWNYATQLMHVLIGNKKHRFKILDILKQAKEEGSNVSRWDLYNSVTQFATHGENITIARERSLQRRAEQLLVDVKFNTLKVKAGAR